MFGERLGERPFINLNRRDAEIEINGETFSLRQFSSVNWRRGQYMAVNQAAYAIFQQLAACAPPEVAYLDIPLIPLMQRHLTTALVQALAQSANLQPFFQAQQPSLVDTADSTTSRLARLAARQATTQAKIVGPMTSVAERLAAPRHFLENVSRNFYFLFRLAGLLKRQYRVPPKQSERVRLLFHPYYRNHLPTFLPLIRQLAESDRYELLVAGADTNTLRRGDVDSSPLQALNILYLPFEAAVNLPQLLTSMTRSVGLTTKLGQKYRQAKTWQVLGLDEAIRVVIQPIVVNLLETRLPKILLYLDMALMLYRQLQPDLVIVADEALPVLGRIALHTAQQSRIPTLTMQHGLLLDDPAYYGPTLADCFALWGDGARDFLLTHGGTANRLVCVGATRFGKPDAGLEPLDLIRILGLTRDTMVIIFLSQPGGHDVSIAANLETVRALATAVAKLPNCHLLIKPHPAQSIAELNSWQAAVTNMPVTIQSELPLHAALLGAAVSVTVFSTAGLEALWLDRPLLTINLTDRPDLIPYGEGGAAIVAHTVAEIAPALKQALDPADQAQRAPARREFVRRYLGVLDGAVLDRLVALVDEMTISHAA